jgi:hypothetical protein
MVNAFSNISNEYVRSSHFFIDKIHSSDTSGYSILMKKINEKCATIRIWKKANFDKTLCKKDLQNEEEGLHKIYIK